MTPESPSPQLTLEVDGRRVEVPDDGTSLLSLLRERLGIRSLKDGCSPQGQCGCCTVLVDGQPRVACVTPARRVRDRSITTLDGLDPARRRTWGEAFCASGASQCGFCTPGIVMRLEALRARGAGPGDTAAVEQALLAHLCRCTGWRTILDAWSAALAPTPSEPAAGRDLEAAARRAALEGRTHQRVAPDVALGQGGFADDLAPHDALVAVPDGVGGWAVGDTLAGALAVAGKVQGRRTTVDLTHPLELPAGDWVAALRTTWVEPAYLELDASWCRPGGEPFSPLANGGAFGGKLSSVASTAARELAERHGRPVRVLLSREDAVRLNPKRPPVAGGIGPDGTGVLRVVRTPGIGDAVAQVAPGLRVEEVDVPGPPTSTNLRGAGWAEALVLLAAARAASARPGYAPRTDRVMTSAAAPSDEAGPAAFDGGASQGDGPGVIDARAGSDLGIVELRSPDGAVARAEVALGADPHVRVRINCGEPLDDVVVRSYGTGAAHMALGWVCREGLAVDEAGEIRDLTIRSFGVLRAVDTPPIDIEIERAMGPPVNGSDAVFAAVAAATWLAQGRPVDWPTNRLPRTAPSGR